LTFVVKYYIYVVTNLILLHKYSKKGIEMRLLNKIMVLLVMIFTINSFSQTFEQLEGTWKSVRAEDLHNGTYGTRVFTFDKNAWKVDFTLYLDKEMKKPVFVFTGSGKYEFEGKSKMYNTMNALFQFEQKSLQLLINDEQIAAQFGFAGMKQGEKRDLTKEGVSFLKSVIEQDREYDIVKVEANQLFLGMRPADNDLSKPEKRPVMFMYPLEKVKQGELPIVTNPSSTVYAIINVTIKNQEEFVKYVMGHLPTLDLYGGKIIFESTKNVAIEGSAIGNFFLIQEWPSEEQFTTWWNSTEYKPWKDIRHLGADVTVVLSTSRF